MEWSPTTLIIGPGGVKGYLEIGALQTLEFFLVLKGIRRVVGISVGAVLALLWVAGYNFFSLADVALHLDLSRDVFVMKPFRRGSFMSKNGFFSTAGIEAYLRELLLAKFPSIPTMAELYRRRGLDLVVVSTNVTTCGPIYISRENYPDLSCIEAVVMSMSIPLVYEYHELNGQRYVDGALTDPLPVQLYADENQLVIRIVDNASQAVDLLSFVYTAISVSMEYMIKEKLTRMMADEGFRKRCRIVELATSNFNPVNPSMTTEEKENMINQGRKIATEFVCRTFPVSPDAIPTRPAGDHGSQPSHPGRHFRRRLRPLQAFSDEPADCPESGGGPSGNSTGGEESSAC